MKYEAEIQNSVRYLASEQAQQALLNDPYWPKWDSPWWHMLLLHEMGVTKRIPESTVLNFITALNEMPIKIFPIHSEDIPKGIDPYRKVPCHCQLGNVYQVLAAWGIDVDRELPWMRRWLLAYQMPDGGLNCDSDAYLVENEIPSSMVGTIAAFEAILLYTPREWTVNEKQFLDQGARFLIHRKLMYGSTTQHNAEEREEQADWVKLCFPRFYFYDVLRGLNALLLWSEKTKQPLPPDSIATVVSDLSERFAAGHVKNERRAYEGVRTILQSPSGEWIKKQNAPQFPLLESVSVKGEASPFLSQQWIEACDRMAVLRATALGPSGQGCVDFDSALTEFHRAKL